jgi:hypothetical protein
MMTFRSFPFQLTVMKKLTFLALFLVTAQFGFGQASNDRRGFQGTVTATATKTVRHDGSASVSETKGASAIQITARTIVIESDTYDIVKKEFDGKQTTTFTCTKRRSTFEIAYKVGESISVVDQSNKDEETLYTGLQEK